MISSILSLISNTHLPVVGHSRHSSSLFNQYFITSSLISILSLHLQSKNKNYLVLCKILSGFKISAIFLCNPPKNWKRNKMAKKNTVDVNSDWETSNTALILNVKNFTMGAWTVVVHLCVFVILFNSKFASEGNTNFKEGRKANCEDLLPGQYPCNFTYLYLRCALVHNLYLSFIIFYLTVMNFKSVLSVKSISGICFCFK